MYLVIGYKQSKEDYCRGCRMGTWREDTRLEKFPTAQEAAEYIAFNEAFDYDGRQNDWNWVVVTGESINDPESSFYGQLDNDDIHEDVLGFLPEIRKSERARAEQMEKDRKAAEKQQQNLKRQQEQDAQDKIDYERLKTKFEG